MMFKSVAGEFVEKAVQLINMNVNVMDSEGIIIASSDITEIGIFHEGAILAINRKDIVVVKENDLGTLQDTKEGVSIPIYIRGILSGVIGIEGKYDEIITYGKLLKMNLELYLENSLLVEEQLKHRNLKDEFYLSLIKEGVESYNNDVVEAYTSQLELNDYHILVIVKFLELDPIVLSSKIYKTLKIIDECNLNFAVRLSRDKIAYVVTNKTNEKLRKSHSGILQNIEKLFNDRGISDYKIYVGLSYKGIVGIKKSYKTALNLLETEVISKEKVLFANKNMFDVVPNLSQESLEKEELYLTWKKLVDNDKHHELIESINTYFSQNCESKLSAEILNIHRNTLNYRFDKIYNITGLNPRIKKELFALLLCQNIYLNYKNK